MSKVKTMESIQQSISKEQLEKVQALQSDLQRYCAHIGGLEVEKAKAAHKDQKAIEKQLVDAKVLTIGTKGKIEDALKILSDKEKKIHNASIEGDRMTLKADSFIPGTMAVIYLLILIYFRSQGGYKPVKIED